MKKVNQFVDLGSLEELRMSDFMWASGVHLTDQDLQSLTGGCRSDIFMIRPVRVSAHVSAHANGC